MYVKGVEVKRDYKKGLNLLQIAAVQGNAEAQYNLGVTYYNGFGVKQDYQTAKKLWEIAAKQNHAYAQHNLAAMYLSGKGVEKNLPLAAKLLKQSCANGDKTSCEDCKRLDEFEDSKEEK